MIYAESLLSIGFVFLSVIVVIGMIKNRDIILNWVSTKKEKRVSGTICKALKVNFSWFYLNYFSSTEFNTMLIKLLFYFFIV